MDIELLMDNIEKYASKKGTSLSGICKAAGLSKNYASEARKKSTPKLAPIFAIAQMLDVSVSDLVGDAKTPAELAPLADAWAELNDEGRARLIEYAEDLVAGGRYIKNHLSKEA